MDNSREVTEGVVIIYFQLNSYIVFRILSQSPFNSNISRLGSQSRLLLKTFFCAAASLFHRKGLLCMVAQSGGIEEDGWLYKALERGGGGDNNNC